MKISAVLGLKDELELLPSVIAHLEAIGVDVVVARDAGSTDGCAEWLAAHAGDRLRLAPIAPEEFRDDDLWARREAEIAQATGADWTLFLDADEFWLPAGGDLRHCGMLHDAGVDVVIAPRYNVALTPDRSWDGAPDLQTLLRQPLFVQPIPDLRAHLEAHPDTPWISGVPMPKMIARPGRIASVHLGHHGANGANALHTERATEIVIAHLPFSTYARFERKVRNIADMLAQHPDMFPGHGAWHWKRWVRIDRDGGLRNEFERQRLGSEALASLRACGHVRTAASLLPHQDNEGLQGPLE